LFGLLFGFIVIIGKVLGGLGNQMFQYAAVRALALRRQVPLRLDATRFFGYTLHQGFELNAIFDCSVPLATPQDMTDVLGWQATPIAQRVLGRLSMARFRSSRWLTEPHFTYWEELKSAPNTCYIDGYWQSNKYFDDVEDIIRKDFCFRQPMSSKNSLLAAKIGDADSVSLHVRRGDYVTNKDASRIHTLCSIDYYDMSIREMANRIGRPHFFVFSDDVAWAKENISMAYPCDWIDHNIGSESYNDMRLMSLCKHHIVANSTFSWWGAWLNPSLEKVVMAPHPWFANELSARDLIPNTWLRLGGI